jgi:hypothetical protein
MLVILVLAIVSQVLGALLVRPVALQRVRGARWRGFVLIAQLLLSQVPKAGRLFPKVGTLARRSLVCSVLALHFSELEHGPTFWGLGAYRRDRARPAWRDWPPDSSPHEAAHSSPRLHRKTRAKRALQRMALAGLSRSSRGFVIKMAPARGSAPRPSKVFPFQIARRSSGYPSGVPIEAGKRGNVCSVLNRTWKNIELPARVGALLGTCVVAESRIHRSRGIVETNREKVAAPAISSQSTGAVSSSLAQTLLLI